MLCFRRVLDLNTGAEHKIVLFAFVSQHLTQQNASLAFHQKSHCISK